jgi:hypothetical protein
MAERGDGFGDELYVGYLPEAPAGVAAWIRRTVVLLFLAAVPLAVGLAAAQRPFANAVFELGVERELEGVVRETPHPVLEVTRPGAASDAAAVSRYLLVNPFKHGAAVAGRDGLRVRARGSLVYRDDLTMVEIVPEEIEELGGGGLPSRERRFGVHTLVGRIVDSKCYLGVMKPGEGKPHRACAARCISGGIPPLFVVSDRRGPALRLLLVGADGRAVNDEVLGFVAEPLEIRGEVVRVDDLWILKADPETYQRI